MQVVANATRRGGARNGNAREFKNSSVNGGSHTSAGPGAVDAETHVVSQYEVFKQACFAEGQRVLVSFAKLVGNMDGSGVGRSNGNRDSDVHKEVKVVAKESAFGRAGRKGEVCGPLEDILRGRRQVGPERGRVVVAHVSKIEMED